MSRGLIGICVLVAGCAHHSRVQNPFPGVFRVAVIPFNDKTGGTEGLDTLHLTQTFASELQKIPSFEVIPVHEVREVLGGARVESNQPALAFAVARAVHAQAVIVGDITEYKSYYPPRLGLHCEMYAMVTGEPEAVVETMPAERPGLPVPAPPENLRLRFANGWKFLVSGRFKLCGKRCGLHGKKACAACAEANGAADPVAKAGATTVAKGQGGASSSRTDAQAAPGPPAADGWVLPGHGEILQQSYLAPPREPAVVGADAAGPGNFGVRGTATGRTSKPPRLDAIPSARLSTVVRDRPTPIVEPWVVRHSRVFDGANLGLFYKLEDYYFFHKDHRGGGVHGYLERSQDFQRFACNRMIYEMLKAAGGEWSPLWGLKIPAPGAPWPWR